MRVYPVRYMGPIQVTAYLDLPGNRLAELVHDSIRHIDRGPVVQVILGPEQEVELIIDAVPMQAHPLGVARRLASPLCAFYLYCDM